MRGTLTLFGVQPGVTIGLGRGVQLAYQQPFLLKVEGDTPRFAPGDGRLTGAIFIEPLGTKLILGPRIGVALPTGPSPGQPSIGLFGGGTFDPLVGFDMVVWGQRFGLLATTDARIPLYANRKGYRGPRAVSAAVGPTLRLGEPLRRLQLLLLAHADFSTPEQWQGEDWDESGRVALGVTLGINWNIRKDVAMFATLKVNAWEWTRGEQFAQPFVLGVGVSGFVRPKRTSSPESEDEHG